MHARTYVSEPFLLYVLQVQTFLKVYVYVAVSVCGNVSIYIHVTLKHVHTYGYVSTCMHLSIEIVV